MSEATQNPTTTERELALLRMGLRSLRKEFSEKLNNYRLKPPVTDNDMEVVEHFKRDIAEIDALIAKYAAPIGQDSRNAVLEEAAKAIESDTIQWGQQRMGRVNASHFAFVIRALKNDPPQQDSKEQGK